MDYSNDKAIKEGASSSFSPTKSVASYDEYLMAMRRIHRRQSTKNSIPVQMLTPRERHRIGQSKTLDIMDAVKGGWSTVQETRRISIIASMVPDEIIYQHHDRSVRSYETALMFIDISGFTKLCENYTKVGHGGPSKLTQVLNSYIGSMVQEILTHHGDVLKFSGDAFLSMWKKTPRLRMQDIVHAAIDCGLNIQKNYGTYQTDIGVILKVKIAISAGLSHFSIIGGDSISQTHYVIVGQPVWDVKMAEYMSTAGDVLTTASAWIYVNEAEYCTQPCGDGRHTKVLGVGAAWKRVEKLQYSLGLKEKNPPFSIDTTKYNDSITSEITYREYSLRPSVVAAMRSSWWLGLRAFMLTPVLRAVDNDEPMDFLTEVRRVVVVFLNIITKTVTENVLIDVVNNAYKCVSSLTSAAGGLVNKVSMFDKDMMFLVVFGLRGLKHEDEAQKALQCAFQLKENLKDENITTVSIAVTSGTTYCGVVGHLLRREYTVIGAAVNKAARLMMAYPNKVTCDKETFLRSKLDQEHFRILDMKPLKGIAMPGPVYEFNIISRLERPANWRHPLLGRNDELHKYKATLQNAIQQRNEKFTRYRDHKFAIAFIGPRFIGKTRLLDQCLNITPRNIQVDRIVLSDNKVAYGLFRKILAKIWMGNSTRIIRENRENKIRFSIDTSSITPTQIYAINTIFDCQFPLPETFTYKGDILSEVGVKHIIQHICKSNITTFWVLGVLEAQHIDKESWRILIYLLEAKVLFVLMTITEEEKMLPTASNCLANNMIVKIHITGVDRWYLAALTCQLLDVQAIPADLQKLIESASNGMPGWIQNFVISLVQRGALSVVTVTRSEALGCGAVMPSPTLLQRAECDVNLQCEDLYMRQTSHKSVESFLNISMVSKQDSAYAMQETDTIQMAVLAESFNFDDIKVDMTMDALILKTYDSLTPFEKMLLKCGSVLGEVFSRRMLLHLLQSDSPRKVAQAVEKLFMIRVLECEGGDFTRDTSQVLVHPAPAWSAAAIPPYCGCLGTKQPPYCRDLPMYAFCGYMKFRHSLFRTTTYELLTASQKREMHARVLLYLERYTRRCIACGAGCFTKLLGLRCDNGLTNESDDLKRIKQQICALSAETRVPGDQDPSSGLVHENNDFSSTNVPADISSYELLQTKGNLANRILVSRNSRYSAVHTSIYQKNKWVRSFSSLDLDNCECPTILLSVYCQIIDHCRGAGEFEKLYDAYLEYADISIINLNIPQAIRLLFEVENFIADQTISDNDICKSWIKKFRLATIYSMRGVCMLESGDLTEARKLLLLAMKLYGDPFPISKHRVRMCNVKTTLRQLMALHIAPNLFVGRDVGVIGYFYEDIAMTLHRLYRLFTECKETENATLAAKCALNYALITNSNFRVLCVSYGNIITTYRLKQNFSKCLSLEKRAMEICHRKRGQIDVTEIDAVCYMYTSIFLFYVESGKKVESLKFGLSIMHMMSSLTDLNTRQILVLWMLKLLMADLRIHDMVAIMRDLFYMTDHYDLSSETWYYFYAMLILLDTGYCVESYATCEMFYMKKGDAILRSKTPEAAWNFIVSMWLVAIRIGAWERAILWEEKIKGMITLKFEHNEFSIMLLVRLVEGLLITLVNEMDNRNIKKIIIVKKAVKTMFQEWNRACGRALMYRPRYYLLFAYYHYIEGKQLSAFKYLNKARDAARQYSHGIIMIWTEHTRNHWKGTLLSKYEGFWANHIESDSLLDYRNFDPDKSKIVPYTLPLPREFEK